MEKFDDFKNRNIEWVGTLEDILVHHYIKSKMKHLNRNQKRMEKKNN